MTRPQQRGGFDIGDYVDVAERIAEFRTKHPEGSLQPLNPEQPYRIEKFGDDVFIVYTAAAYRTPDDQRPGIGVAQEGYPGRTPYTRGSELQNAETSAWGRAIVAALAANTKRGIATAEEVRNRAAERERPVQVVTPWPELVNRAAKAITDAKTHEDLEKISRRLTHLVETEQMPEDEATKLRQQVTARYDQLAAPPSGFITDKQNKQLHALVKKANLETREDKLQFCTAVLAREVITTSELSSDEAEKVIAALQQATREKKTEAVPA